MNFYTAQELSEDEKLWDGVGFFLLARKGGLVLSSARKATSWGTLRKFVQRRYAKSVSYSVKKSKVFLVRGCVVSVSSCTVPLVL